VLSKKYRLTKRGSFTYVYKKGEGGATSALRMQFVRSSSLKIGFSVSNKIGKAHVRNLVKRRMRAAMRELIKTVAGGYQIVFSAKIGIEALSYQRIKGDMGYLLKRARMFKADVECR